MNSSLLAFCLVSLVCDIRNAQYAIREFLLVHPPGAAYNLYGVDFPIFEPDVKALRSARHLRDTDGDGVWASEARDFRFRLGRLIIEMRFTENASNI